MRKLIILRKLPKYMITYTKVRNSLLEKSHQRLQNEGCTKQKLHRGGISDGSKR